MSEPDGKRPKLDEPSKGLLLKTDSQKMAAIDRGEADGDEGSLTDGFPDTLEGFKLAFNEKGQLRSTVDGQPFVFAIKSDHSYNQKRYEHLGEIITEYVYSLLEREVNLKRHYLANPPLSNAGVLSSLLMAFRTKLSFSQVQEPIASEEQSFVFMSEDVLSKPRLMILIHGSGVVRAGQWARRLIINDNLDCGTQLPYIRRAQAEGYGVLVTNTNFNSDKSGLPIKHNSSPLEHADCVWKTLIKEAAATEILIVAHSYGGVVVSHLATSYSTEFLSRVKGVAFTDSVHCLEAQKPSKKVKQFFMQHTRNWVSSDLPLDTEIPNKYNDEDSPFVSAGHHKHEWTSHSAIDSVFKFLRAQISEAKEEL